MKLGYIHMSREEQDKYLQVIKLLSEPGSLDELGIGRIRDFFSNKMFPGVSTLQTHLKYFSLMPQVYKRAIEKRYNRISEVKEEIRRLEQTMTRVLFEYSEEKEGIIGSDVIRRNPNEYVKYDPAYIFNSGMMTYGILHNSQVNQLIYAASKKLHENPTKFKAGDNDEDSGDDAMETNDVFRFCEFPKVDYDFTKYATVSLTPEDEEFITRNILNSNNCKGSLLRFIVENKDVELGSTFPGVNPDLLHSEYAEMRDIQDCAKKFSDFNYLLSLRYNMIYSIKNSADGSGQVDQKMADEFDYEFGRYLRSCIDFSEVLQIVDISEGSSKQFCQQAAGFMAAGDWDSLDKCIISREKSMKGSRRKIGNPSYVYDPKAPAQHERLSYRWRTVCTFAKELGRKVVQNG